MAGGTIIEEVKALGTGAEVEVAKVAIDNNNYDVKFKLDSTGNSENISDNIITITRTAAPSDQAGLAKIINDLYVKQDGSGGFTIGTDITDAAQLSCDKKLFAEKTVGDCTAITTPALTTILDEVKQLTADDNTATVGTVLIESDATPYDIILKKVTLGTIFHRYIIDPVIDKVTHKITVEVKETPDTADKITTAIDTITVGGTVNSPAYEVGGKVVNCLGDFNTAKVQLFVLKLQGWQTQY